MGRKPCCAKEGVNRGAWTVKEDRILTSYINIHGEGKWRSLPQNAGLNRCGKSCRLRWLNYLKPDIKRGNISTEEEDLIIRLHKLLGNRWSLIARRLPGRTDNEIKNYWNTTLIKKISPPKKEIPNKTQKRMKEQVKVKCSEVVPSYNNNKTHVVKDQSLFKSEDESPSTSDIFVDFDINDVLFSDLSDILEFEEEKEITSNDIDFSISSMEALLDGSNVRDESILMDDSEDIFASLDKPNENLEQMFNEARSFLNFEDEWFDDCSNLMKW